MLRHQPVLEFKVKRTLVFKKEVPKVQVTDSYVEPHSSLTLDACALIALLVLIDALLLILCP